MAKTNPLAKLTERMTNLKTTGFGAVAEETVAMQGSAFRMMAINQIEVNTERNIRNINTEDPEFQLLILSIKEKGIEQNLCVEPHDGERPFRLVFGYRRIHAAIAAGLKEVPVIIRNFASDGERYLAAMIENIHREDMHAVEIGRAIYLAAENGIPKEEIIALNGWKEEKTFRKYYRIGSWSNAVRNFCLTNPNFFNTRFLFNKITDEIAGNNAKLLKFLQDSLKRKPQNKPTGFYEKSRKTLSHRIGKPVSLSPGKNGYLRVTLTLTPEQLNYLESVEWK